MSRSTIAWDLGHLLQTRLVDGEMVGIPCCYTLLIEIYNINVNVRCFVSDDGAGRSALGFVS